MPINAQRKLLVDEYIKLRCKNAKQAAINAGYSEKSAQAQASQILNDAKVKEYLEERKSEIARELRQEFMFDALEARKVMYKIMIDNNAEDKDRLNAAKDFLDRAGFKAVDKMELTGTLETEKTKLDDLIRQIRGGSG